MAISPLEAEVINWIYADVDPATFREVSREFAKVPFTPRPAVGLARTKGNPCAACVIGYPQQGAARVLGYRIADGGAQELRASIQQACNKFSAVDLTHLQIMLPAHENRSRQIFEEIGFKKRAEICQLWRSVKPAESDVPAAFELPFRLLDVGRFTRDELCELLAAISSKSRDHMNADDSSSERLVKELWSTLEFDRLDSRLSIDILALDRKPIGILAIDHLNQKSELVYLGVDIAYRRRGLGHGLATYAIHSTAAKENPYLVTAVDAENLPARRLYSHCQFHQHAAFSLLEIPVCK